MNPYNTPGLAPRFQSEVDDYDRLNDVQNHVLDPRFQSLRRQAGPHSPYYRNQDQDLQARDMSNKAQVFRNRVQQGASDRDLQWRAQQDNQAWQRGVMDRQLSAQEKATDYAHQRDTINDTRADKQNAIAYAMQKMNSPDELVRAEGQDDYERLMGGGPAAASVAPRAAAPVQAGAVAQGANEGSGEGSVATPSPTGAPAAMNPRMAIAMKEREARLRQMEEDRQMAREDRSFNQARTRADDAEMRQSNQRKTKMDWLKLALENAKSPADRAKIMNQGASSAAELPPLVNQPTGMMGIGDAVGGALKSAYNQADQAGQVKAGATFTVDPLEQARYEAEQKRGIRGLGQQEAFTDVADAQKILQSDPGISNAISALKRELATTGKRSWWQSSAGSEDARAFSDKIKRVAAAAAARYPGVSAESLHQVILSQLNDTLQSDQFDPTSRDRFSSSLYAPPEQRVVAPADAAKYPGAKVNRFAQRE